MYDKSVIIYMKGGEIMNDRIKELRKKLNMSQDVFAKTLGLTKNYISLVENGSRNLSEQSLKILCSALNVNEDWLRNGTGEMFLKLTKDEEIANMLGEIHNDSGNHFKRRFVAALAKLNESDWDSLEKLVDEIVKQKED